MPSSKQSRVSYNCNFKLRAVALAESVGNREAGKQLGIDESLPRRWQKEKPKILAQSKKDKTYRILVPDKQTSRAAHHDKLEEGLMGWLNDARTNGRAITGHALQMEARRAAARASKESGSSSAASTSAASTSAASTSAASSSAGSSSAAPTAAPPGLSLFKASDGWLRRFKGRKGLSTRFATSLGQKIPRDAQEKIDQFHRYVIRLREQHQIHPKDIYNMDETPVQFDMPTGRTLAPKGSKTVLVKTNGAEKRGFTCVLTVSATGEKLDPFIIFKGKRALKTQVRGVHFTVQEKGYIDYERCCAWIQKSFPLNCGRKRLLVWDSCAVHLTEAIKSHLAKRNILVAVIPGGLTPLLQPLDVSINRPFKVELPDLGSNDIRLQVKACGLSLPPNKLINEVFRKAQQERYAVGHEVAGVVTHVGPAVSSVQVGDKVTGLLPLNSPCPGCANFCQLNEYDVVRVPEGVSLMEAAAVVGDGVRAYMALHYQARVCGGDTVLVTDAASSFGTTCIQLAQIWGAKVICTVSSQEERIYLGETFSSLAQIIELNDKGSALLGPVMEETGGTGIDVIIDRGVRMFSGEEEKNEVPVSSSQPLPSKHELISCLGVSGRWVTSQADLQLDPPDSQLLFLKAASVSFLFEHTWTLAPSQHGRYQHVLQDLMSKVANGSLKPKITKTVSLENAIDVLKTLHEHNIGKAVAAM